VILSFLGEGGMISLSEGQEIIINEERVEGLKKKIGGGNERWLRFFQKSRAWFA
jgi:hypothetical protein